MPTRGNGSPYPQGMIDRVNALEAGQAEIKRQGQQNSDTLIRLQTHLTGEGVKGDQGVLGQMADTLKEIAGRVRKFDEQREADKAEIKKIVHDEVQEQLSQQVVIRQATFWQRQTALVKWLVGSFVTAIIAAVMFLIIADLFSYIAQNHH